MKRQIKDSSGMTALDENIMDIVLRIVMCLSAGLAVVGFVALVGIAVGFVDIRI